MEITQCLQNNAKEILVVGSRESRRGEWFEKAAMLLGFSVKYIEWEHVKEQKLAPSMFIKLDPPSSPGADFDQLDSYVEWYKRQLSYLNSLGELPFLNSPAAIALTLDKVSCKRRLAESGIPVTPAIEAEIGSYDELILFLKSGRVRDIFIKPRFGAGAAGILAYRFHPGTGQEVLYTSMKREGNKLYNTKAVYRLTEHDEIKWMADRILKQPVILEKWIPKARHQGIGYDIRAVYQFGQVDFMVARGSSFPMTNLHLNNHAIPFGDLCLAEAMIEEIKELCCRTAQCMEGLFVAGIDILITPSGSLKVIEVNGQGDLIYQDIFHENLIYRRQIEEGVKKYGTDRNTGDTAGGYGREKTAAESGYE